MDSASDADLEQVAEDPADAPLVEAAADELDSDMNEHGKKHDE